jgi:glycosyltransferase involved in cell wall biosynthesis
VRVVATVPAIVTRGRFGNNAGIPKRDSWDGIEVSYPRFLVIPKVARFLHGWEYFYSIRRAVKREIQDFRPDVILAYFAYPYGFAAVQFGRMLGLPVVISCRGSDINHMSRPRLQGRMISSSLHACRRVFVMSDEMRTRVLSFGLDPARVEIVSNGVDAERFCPMDRAQARSQLGIPNEGRAVVFEGPEDYHHRIEDPALNIDERSMLFIRGTGPIGYPGGAEVVNMQPPAALIKRGILSLPCIGDGRQSGTSGSPSILNASPEAAVGGGLALLKTGDKVRVDIGKRRADILITDAELAKRRAAWKPNVKESQTPWQELQRKFIGQLSSGACLDFAVNYQKIAATKGVPRHSH